MLAAAAFIFFGYGPGRNFISKEKSPTASTAPTAGNTNLTNAAAGTNTADMGVAGVPIRMRSRRRRSVCLPCIGQPG
jgi:hypothetical protein